MGKKDDRRRTDSHEVGLCEIYEVGQGASSRAKTCLRDKLQMQLSMQEDKECQATLLVWWR